MLGYLLTSSAPPPPSTTVCGDNCTFVWFGQGCFWERQWAYVNIELDEQGPFARTNSSVSSRVGYAGSLKSGANGLVCYHNNEDPTADYAALGHAEQVRVELDQSKQEAQFAALCDSFFAAFTVTPSGFMRPE